MSERRIAPRSRAGIFANQYIDGFPHLADVLELSMTGALVRRVHAPDAERAGYALEIPGTDGESVWLCASSVWRVGEFEAVRFVETSHVDRLRLAGVLGQAKLAS